MSESTTTIRLMEAGGFTLIEKDGQRFWRSNLDRGDETVRLDHDEPLILKPGSWEVGTVITAMVPIEEGTH
jgi:hypothetical protein